MSMSKGQAANASTIRRLIEPMSLIQYDITVDGKRWVGCNLAMMRARGSCVDVRNTYAEHYLRKCVAESVARNAATRAAGSREIRDVRTVAFVAPGSAVEIHVGSDVAAIVRKLFPGSRWRVPSEHPLFPKSYNTCVAWLGGHPVAVVPPLKGKP